FALFLGSAARFKLRVPWTWLCLTASVGGTMALATYFDVGGLPALPLLSLGFLLPNADILWRAVRQARAKRVWAGRPTRRAACAGTCRPAGRARAGSPSRAAAL